MTTNIDSLSRTFILLAPSGQAKSRHFGAVHANDGEHERLMRSMQQLRGRVYLQDGAITRSSLDSQGRHHIPGDEESWHLLRMRHNGAVAGCARILVHPSAVSYRELRLASSGLAKCTTWGSALRRSMEHEMASVRDSGRSLIEPGGWALAEDLRGSTEGLCIAVGALAWAQIFGGCIGFMTATVRHGSASMLRRLGGDPVKVDGRGSASYYDQSYGCDMELLRFDSQALNPRFQSVFLKTQRMLRTAPVIEAKSTMRMLLAA